MSDSDPNVRAIVESGKDDQIRELKVRLDQGTAAIRVLEDKLNAAAGQLVELDETKRQLNQSRLQLLDVQQAAIQRNEVVAQRDARILELEDVSGQRLEETKELRRALQTAARQVQSALEEPVFCPACGNIARGRRP